MKPGLPLADPKGKGALGTRTLSLGPISFIFMQFSAKQFRQNGRLVPPAPFGVGAHAFGKSWIRPRLLPEPGYGSVGEEHVGFVRQDVRRFPLVHLGEVVHLPPCAHLCCEEQTNKTI